MPKKKITSEEPEVIEQVTQVFGPIGLLSVEFSREDLNLLRDKINELVNRENAKQSSQ